MDGSVAGDQPEVAEEHDGIHLVPAREGGASVYDLALSGNILYLGGDFVYVDFISRSGLAAIDLVHHQLSPPTINIFDQDPQCDVDYCANAAREMRIDLAMKNNFGFGGTNGTLVFRRV